VGRFDGVRLVLLDLDGTVYQGSRVVDGAAEAVRRLRVAGFTLRFLTNTDSVSPAALVGRLEQMGIAVAAEEVLTPVVLAGRLFGQIGDARILAVASEEVRAELTAFLVKPGRRPTHVLVADPSYGATYADLDAAFRAVRAGAELVATQVAPVVRRDDGEHLDTGGWVRLLEYAAGVQARVLGKPSPDFFRLALDSAASTPGQALVVGDDRTADVAGGQAVGARAVLVRTGKGVDPGPAPAAGPGPDAIIDSVADLPDLLAGDPGRPAGRS
jgi:HAD superfamily hydrolase (TIGR01458 family)